MSYRIYELPEQLWPGGKPALQLLCARDKKTTSWGRLFLGKNFAFSGKPADSYRHLHTFNRFAWQGKLLADYPASAQTIDLETDLSIQLEGPDLILDEIHDFDAIHGEYWMIIGDEIMFPAKPQLTGVGSYTLKTVRGRFGTVVQPHAAGASIYIMRSEDFAPLSHPSFKRGSTGHFKMTLGVQQVCDQEAVEVSYMQG